MSLTIFHNPRCSKSRQTLARLEQAGVTPTVRRYLDDPPSEAELRAAARRLEGGAAALLTYKRVLTALEVLRSNDIRFDGGLYGWLTPHQEAALLANEAQFSNTDYIETSILGAPYRMRNWLNVKWLTHTGLPSVGTASARCFVWHQTAIGHGIQATATTDIQYYNTHAAHFIQSHLSQGAVLIDTRGVCRIDVDDTVAI